MSLAMTPTHSSQPSRSRRRVTGLALLCCRGACLLVGLVGCIDSTPSAPEARDGSVDAGNVLDAHAEFDAHAVADDAGVLGDDAGVLDAHTEFDAHAAADDAGVLGDDAGVLDPLVIGKASGIGEVLETDDWMIYAQPFRMPFDALIEEFGMTCAPTLPLGRARLSIYTDDGSTGGHPAVLINRGREVGDVVTGENTATPVNSSTLKRMLTAGVKYWLVAYIREYPGAAVRMYRESEADPAGDYRSGALSYGDPAPTLTDTPTVVESGRISLWIRVSRAPAAMGRTP